MAIKKTLDIAAVYKIRRITFTRKKTLLNRACKPLLQKKHCILVKDTHCSKAKLVRDGCICPGHSPQQQPRHSRRSRAHWDRRT